MGNQGVTPSGSGLRPFGAEPQDASQAEPLVPNALLDLADRCEQATGPNRVLDAEIYVGLDPELGNLDALAINGAVGSWVPNFTASIDDALTLVPICPMTGGDRWAVQLDSGFYGATAELWHECSLDKHHGHAGGQHEAMCRALCGATLRARAASAMSTGAAATTQIGAGLQPASAVAKPDAQPTHPIDPGCKEGGNS